MSSSAEIRNVEASNEVLGAFYDHVITIKDNVVCLLGWERYTGNERPNLVVTHGGNDVSINKLETIFYKRPDVNKHFEDDLDQQWGVARVFTVETDEIENLADLSYKLELEETGVSVDANFSQDINALLNATSMMNDAELGLVKKFLLEPYSQEIIAKQVNAAVGIEQLPGFVRIHTDTAFSINEYGVFFQGWLVDADSNLLGIYLQQQNKLSKNLLDNKTSFPRLDVNEAFNTKISSRYKAGLYGVFEFDEYDVSKPTQLVFLSSGGNVAIKPLEVSSKGDDPVRVIQSLLAPFDIKRPGYEDEFNGYLGKAIESVWKGKKFLKDTEEVTFFGEITKSPICSLIIPIYGRYDFVMYQMAQFSKDDDLKNAEIIYVLDDPRLLNEFNHYCAGVYSLFNVPFKTVVYDMNLGFAGANNRGVTHATSEMLLLLNSDVMPKETGWLNKMLASYKSAPDAGVLGARLVFEDETIQHDGLSYQQVMQYGNLWLIEHPGKGLPVSMKENKGLHSIASITGACMMMETLIYNELEGLDESYILGDFEDSDLCLKALESGYKNYLDSDISLYHLERQSQNLFEDRSWKFKLTIYNGIQHTRRWDQLIKKINASEGDV
ncbi:hypothetical protein NBRC116188_18480 [Oceaniserpentilla sp. 4NH20-0058]|uniref:glycosyltransferase family 2 protein n=1 Tax=Oceaniserpentilla sp. 4NH20-0058 TaxID=3127660 RepID=UPI00310C5695